MESKLLNLVIKKKKREKKFKEILFFLLLIMQSMSIEQKRLCFFNVDNTFEVPAEEFDSEIWPLISNIWTRYNSWKCANGDFWTVYACRLMKHNKSSTRQDGIPANKRRNTSTRIEGICEAKIKITHIVASQTVRVERFKDTPHHSHPIEDSDLIKTPEVIRQLVAQEASKPYTPPSIVTTVKVKIKLVKNFSNYNKLNA